MQALVGCDPLFRPLILGLDQVGKSQALGPMVVVAAYARGPLPRIRDTKKATAMDYKLLESLILDKTIGYHYVMISPQELDKENLNTLLTRAQSLMIKTLNPTLAYVDCHLGSTRVLIQKLRAQGVSCGLRVDHRMDQSEPLVAVASLLARRQRLKAMKILEVQAGRPLGSGNVTDPVTKAYLLSGGTHGLRRKWKISYL